MDNGLNAEKQLEWLLNAILKINEIEIINNKSNENQKCDEIINKVKKIENEKINGLFKK
jgi:hypothetical protein